MRTGAHILHAFTVSLACALACAPADAQTVYRCKTERGVIYSQKPCGDDAERREMGPAKNAGVEEKAEPEEFTDLGEEAWTKATGAVEDVLSRLGAPDARYRVEGSEYWLYDSVGRIQNDQKQLIELLIVDGKAAQVNWLSEEVMRNTVAVAREIGDWEPPAGPRTKVFYVTGHDIRGLSKSALLGRFGQPSVKKIFNGIEVWEYREVPMSASDPRKLSLFVEFDGDVVRQSMGN